VSVSASSPPGLSIKPYTLVPTYIPTPLPAIPKSRPGSDYSHSLLPDSHSSSASGARNAPLSFPMLSPMLCVNINTSPCVPISLHMHAGSLPIQLASSHLHPANLHGTINLASVCTRAAPGRTLATRLPQPARIAAWLQDGKGMATRRRLWAVARRRRDVTGGPIRLRVLWCGCDERHAWRGGVEAGKGSRCSKVETGRDGA
jgi:hypothetical protein